MSPLIDDLYGIVPDGMLKELEKLPASLTLVRLAYYRASKDVVAGRRGAFKARLKSRFLQHVGNTERPKLLAMGMTDKLIERMRLDGEIWTHEPAAALCTVDHILSLNLGGNNEFSNMVLLPAHYNDLKNRLEAAQFPRGVHDNIITIVPADPADKVPFIPGGYRRPQKVLTHEPH